MSKASKSRSTHGGTRRAPNKQRKTDSAATDPVSEVIDVPGSPAESSDRISGTLGNDSSNLLETCRTKWQHGAWRELVTIKESTVAQDPERAKLALLLSVAHHHVGDPARSRQMAQNAVEWGADRRVLARLLISAAFNDLGRAALCLDDSETARLQFVNATKLVERHADSELMARTRQIRESSNLGLVNEAVATFGAELQDISRTPGDAAARLEALERELALLRHDAQLGQMTASASLAAPQSQNQQWPELTFPDDEAELVQSCYEEAEVILEYGSGGSTVFGAHLPGKLILSVESDPDWARDLQTKIDNANLPSPVILYHADIGPTGPWGRPVDETHWRLFHRYPTAIWSQHFFRDPDLVLIDGRFRPACFVTTCLRTKKPVTVLFDDYANRPAYHVVEKLMKPTRVVGRLAQFHVKPQKWPTWVHDLQADLFTAASFSTQERVDYGAQK